MIYTPPSTQPTNITASTVQQLSSESTPSALQRSDLPDIIKKLLLRHLVEKSIQENEAAAVLTGVQIVDLQSNKTIVAHDIDTQHFAASINKLPVSLLILQDLRTGAIGMDQIVTWSATDVRAGAGVYDQPGAPLQASVKEVIFDLLNRSGNTAVRILVNHLLGGAAAVNDRWAQIPQLSNTRLQPLDSNRFYVGNSTAHDSLWTMEQLMKKQDSYAMFMKEAMATNIYDDISVRSQLAGNDYIVLVNKVGLLDDPDGTNRHDVGIVYNTKTKKSYGYAMLTTSPYENEAATLRAEQSLKEMGRYVLRFSGDKRSTQEPVEQRSMKASGAIEQRILY